MSSLSVELSLSPFYQFMRNRVRVNHPPKTGGVPQRGNAEQFISWGLDSSGLCGVSASVWALRYYFSKVLILAEVHAVGTTTWRYV